MIITPPPSAAVQYSNIDTHQVCNRMRQPCNIYVAMNVAMRAELDVGTLRIEKLCGDLVTGWTSQLDWMKHACGIDCPAIQIEPVCWELHVAIDGPDVPGPAAAQKASELARLVAASDARVLSLFGCHTAYHKEQRRRVREEGDRVALLRAREIAAQQALFSDETGGEYWELLAEGLQCDSEEDWRRAASAYREAMRPDEPGAYFKLSAELFEPGHCLAAGFAWLAELFSSFRCRTARSPS